MALPIKTGFPDGVTISSKYIVRFRATDPTTGADVAGVKVSVASIFADSEGNVTLEPAGPFMFVPGPAGATV